MKIKTFIKSQRLYEFFKYCLVGGIAFVADTGTLLLLHRFLLSDFELDLLLFRFTDGRTAVAAAAGFIVGLAVNYVLSVFFVFNRPEQKDKGQDRRRVSCFCRRRHRRTRADRAGHDAGSFPVRRPLSCFY